MSVQPSNLLHYLSEFKVVVCPSCQYALQPKAIPRHLKDIHHILRSSRKPFLQYVETLDLDDPETVIRSTNDMKVFPVPLLPVQEGLKCTHQGCSHLCVSEKRMKSHWRQEHERPGRPRLDWSSAPLQTFFRGNSLCYFTKPSSSHVLNHQPPRKPLSGEHETVLLQHYIESTSLTLAIIGNGLEPSWDSLADSAPLNSPGGPKSTEPGANSSPIPLGAQVFIWQEAIPRLAEESPFLMHGILACSALHLAYLRPSERQLHLLTAATHQELAIPFFRKAAANIDAGNCHAILAFVHILAICSLASESENERLLLVDPNGPDAVSHWLVFLRSGCDYVNTLRDTIEQGPLRALLCEWEKKMDIYEGLRTPLVERLLSIVPSQDSEDAWSVKECQIYRDAIHELGYAFICAEKLGKDFHIWDVMRVWPMLVSSDYLQLLQDLHPGALIALAHYCLLLHKLDGRWYLQGRAKRLSGHILQQLDPKWHSHVEWPMTELGHPLDNPLPFSQSFSFEVPAANSPHNSCVKF